MDKLPIFGICMGHQLISLAAGAKTYKLKFGHQANHPVKNLDRQGRLDPANHGYSVDIDSLADTDLN